MGSKYLGQEQGISREDQVLDLQFRRCHGNNGAYERNPEGNRKCGKSRTVKKRRGEWNMHCKGMQQGDRKEVTLHFIQV